ncbi:MAG: PD-(D/E)XK nuclease family transposase [Candidatus Sericytochromatia bacterium]
MLSNLDNEVIFKKAFTDKVVFEQFVKDIVGIDINVGQIETEKKFTDKVGFIDIKFDIFAESVDKRVIIEIQKVEYDYNFDRFMNYFLSAIIEQQKSSKQYKVEQTVYTIVILTEPYTIRAKDGSWIQDEVLLSKLNPRNLKNKEVDLFSHELIFLNPNYRSKDTEQRYKDWLDLIYESIHNPEKPKVNKKNLGIKKAIKLIDKNNLTNEERTRMKESEGKKIVLKNQFEEGKKDEKISTIINGNREGASNEFLSKITGLSIKEIEEILKEQQPRHEENKKKKKK